MRKRVLGLLLVLPLSLSILMTGCSQKNSDMEATVAEETTGTEDGEAGSEIKEEQVGFYVDGTKLMDVNGNEFIMRGINHAHTWFKSDIVKALDAIAGAGANTVRIVLSNDTSSAYENKQEIVIGPNMDSPKMVAAIVERCKMLNMIVVLEVHDATGKNDPEMIRAAVDYWLEVKDEVLIGQEPYVILNIANEWQGTYNKKQYEETYVTAVKRLREAGIKNTILIDAGGWGQTAKSIPECGEAIFEADILKNTMFAIHMYGTAGKNADTIKKNIDAVLEKNLCVCIGEFGFDHSDGDVDEDFIMQYCTEMGVGYLAWSWKGNGGGVEYLDMAKDWAGKTLSPEWGEKVVNGEYGLKATSKICSVFENSIE